MEQDVWTVKRILDWIEGYLRGKGDANPRLSAQWLVSDALGMSRIELYLDPQRPLSEEERATLRDYTRRRGAGEPLQYITGTTDFRFVTVEVEHGVLIPRPETEVLVSEALARLDAVSAVKKARIDAADRALIESIASIAGGEQGESHGNMKDELEEDGFAARFDEDTGEGEDADGEDGGFGQHPGVVGADTLPAEVKPLLVADLCTGTGCIACSIASEIPHARVIATDIDPKAVALAKRNAQRLGVSDRVQVIECDLGSGVDASLMGKFDLVISNPPYIPTSVLASLDAEVTHYESPLALDGGEDGLDIFRRLAPFALDALAPMGVLAVELHETCLDLAGEIARQSGFADVAVANDLAGRPRVLLAQKG